MRSPAALALMLVALAARGQGPPAESPVARVAHLPVRSSQEPAVRQALREATASHDASVAEWLRIARVGATSGHEAERAKLINDLFLQAGLESRILPDGNVEAIIKGRGTGMPAILSAHLDELHAPATDAAVRVENGIVMGPGVLDDASGLATLTRAAALLMKAGWKPEREVRLVATVNEEVGLLGAKSYLAAHPRLAAFVTIDGILGGVDYGATGIRWTRFTFNGRGGHTLLADRTPSPSFAAGRAIASISSLSDETDAPINVGQMSAGIATNAIPTEASFTVDVRSDDPDELSKLSADIARVVRAAGDRESVTLKTESLQDLPAGQLPGHGDSPLVRGAIAILESLDVAPSAAPRGSADHNVAILAGIPAMAVGSTLGRHAHSPEETADVKLLEKGVRQAILLTVLLGEGLPERAAVSE